MVDQTIRTKILREKHLKYMLNNAFLKVKYNLLELEKDFIEFELELKDKEIKIKRETKKLFLKLLIVPMDDMDRFEKKIKKENKTN